MAKPFALNTPMDAPIPPNRDDIGRYARVDAVPGNPLEQAKPASGDQEVMSGWAPGIGQNSAETRGEEKPYEPLPDTASVPQGGFNVK